MQDCAFSCGHLAQSNLIRVWLNAASCLHQIVKVCEVVGVTINDVGIGDDPSAPNPDFAGVQRFNVGTLNNAFRDVRGRCNDLVGADFISCDCPSRDLVRTYCPGSNLTGSNRISLYHVTGNRVLTRDRRLPNIILVDVEGSTRP